MEKICGIYKITSPSGRVYIGESIDVIKRFKSYKNLKINNAQRRLIYSLRKYGYELHIFEVLEKCDILELKCKERYWQDFYNVLCEKGLNCKLTECGELKQVHSDETKAKISSKVKGAKNGMYGVIGELHPNYGKVGEKAPMYGKKGELCPAYKVPRTEEQKNKQSIRMAGKNNSFYGKKHSLDSKVKISLNHADFKGSNNPNSKKILDTDTGAIYHCKKEASESLGININTLSKYLTNKLPNKTSLIYLENNSIKSLRD